MSEDSTMTMISDKYEEESLSHHIHQSISVTESQDRAFPLFYINYQEEPKGYSLIQVKKIDVYSRRIFPILFFIFVFYFFIRYKSHISYKSSVIMLSNARYHAIEGALSYT